jgi:hypothetical protein
MYEGEKKEYLLERNDQAIEVMRVVIDHINLEHGIQSHSGKMNRRSRISEGALRVKLDGSCGSECCMKQ